MAKRLTPTQIDTKFAKALKQARALEKTIQELYKGCESFGNGRGNAMAISAKVFWVADCLEDERNMHD